MKILGVILLIAVMSAGSFAADNGVEIKIIDNKVSMQAKAVPLGRLLYLLDQATGMTSKVTPALANRSVSVQFSGLSFDEAVQKIFEGQKLDYFVLGRGIVVTSASVAVSGSGSSTPFSPAQPVAQDRFAEPPQPFLPPQQQQVQPNGVSGQQPAVVQTPFGPIANPNFQGGNAPANNAPMNVPGQQAPVQNNNNPFGGTLPTYNQNPQPTSPMPSAPGIPNTPTSPFGNPYQSPTQTPPPPSQRQP